MDADSRSVDVRLAARFPAERAGRRRPGRAGGVELHDVARRPIAPASAWWSSIGRRRRRCSRRPARRRLRGRRARLAYEWFLRTHVSQTPVDIVRFSLDRLDPIARRGDRRLDRAQRRGGRPGDAALSAGVVAVGVSVERRLPWRCARDGAVAAAGGRLLRRATRPTIARRSGRRCWWSRCAAVAAWLMHRYRVVDRHGSQAMKLLLSFLAVALPSLMLYPSLVDASERARRQLIETRYAPEVINQRQDLRLKLQKALAEIDRIVALDDLVRASDPPVSGPPPTDAAFLVWSQTSLATERLTSSVELHNASGAMVSRFAMNLPDFTQPQPWTEPSCDWEMLEEVSPLFSEERRLLHAGKRAVRRRAAAAPVRWSCTRCSTTATCRSSRRRIRTSRWCDRQSRPAAAAARRRRVLRLRLEPPRALQLRRGRAAADRRGVPPRLRDRARRSGRRSRRGSNSLDAFVLSDRGAIYVLGDRAAERLRPSRRRGRAARAGVRRVRRRGARRHAVQPAGRPRAGVGPRAVRAKCAPASIASCSSRSSPPRSSRCWRWRWCRAPTWRT